MNVTFIQPDGSRSTVSAEPGLNLMEVAVNSGVPGIDGDCGGMCACATCHVYVASEWVARTGARTQTEADMLEMASEVESNSRLACQISITDELDGLVIKLPSAQY